MSEKKTEWTTEQKNAIRHRRGAAIVSAAAGSGKTAVLTERVASILCDEENYVDAAKIAVLTFTGKAADELKTRLRRNLKQAIKENPEKAAFLKQQEERLCRARISTINSFCFALLRENSEFSDLPPGFSVIDEIRAETLMHRCADTVIESFFKTATESERAAISDYFIGKNDKALEDTILEIYRAAMNTPDYELWLEKCISDRHIENIKKEYIAAVYADIEICEDCFTELNEAAGDFSASFNAYFEALTDSYYDALMDIKSNGGVYTNYADTALECAPARKAVTKDPTVKYLRDRFIDAAQRAIDGAKSLEGFDGAAAALSPIIKTLTRLTRDFCREYAGEKRSRCCADFSDGEQGLYMSIKAHPEIARRADLQLIIVDEFQDSNALQYEIFRRLSLSPDRLFFVGDIKQSIYGFRGAQPEVFSDVAGSADYKLLLLNKNFRSKRCVIDGVNAVFDSIMTKTLGSTDYMKEGRLVCGRDDECNAEDVTEIVSVYCGKDENGTETEAEYVAARIRDMIDSGYTVFGGRPCTMDDFAILMRSPGQKTEVFARALEKYGLTPVIERSEDFLAEREISVMLDMLTVLDDPYNDVALCRLFMSVIYGFDAEKTARIRTGTCGFDISALNKTCRDELKAYGREFRKKPFYTCLLYAAGEKKPDVKKYPALFGEENRRFIDLSADKSAADFVKELNRLQNVLAASSPAETIRTIYDTTDCVNLLTLCKQPDKVLANLNMLLRCAEEYVGNSGCIMSDFLENLKNTAGQKSTFKSAQPRGAETGVRIMSIHGSKGLQFPICFVSDCAKTFNTEDTYRDIIVSGRYGITGKIKNKTAMIKTSPPIYTYASNELKGKLRSEEMRLLYVAATRAEEKLIFTGVTHKEQDKLFEKVLTVPSRIADTDGSSYMSWLMALTKLWDESGAYDEQKGELLIKNGALKFSVAFTGGRVMSEEREAVTKGEGAAADISDAVKETAANIMYRYPYEGLTRIAAKYTATGLQKNIRESGKATRECALYIKKPAFITEKAPLKGKRRGDAYHKLMEHIPFNAGMNADSIAAFIKNGTEGFLSDEERACIVPEDIAAFFRTDVAERMLRSGKIYREYPVFHKLDIGAPALKDLITDIGGDAAAKAEPYVQGIADLFFIEDGRIILIDYKSDSFAGEELLRREYAFQLGVYAAALSYAFSLPVNERYIYSFKLGKMIAVEDIAQF